MDGREPLRVVVPNLLDRAASQVRPFAGVANTLSFKLRFNLGLSFDDASVIRISGLLGGVLSQNTVPLSIASDSEVPVATICDSFGVTGSADWNTASKTLAISLCPQKSTLPGQLFSFSLEIRNPASQQVSPDIEVAISGNIVGLDAVLMIKPNQDAFGVSNALNPLEVIVPTLSIRDMSQRIFLPGVHNTLHLNVSSNVDLY
eukprot:849731-Rhodomonas_salina.1